ncbi:MAG: hypothetical protein PHC88_05645 [Terrimicrobiaceae bacterium]|nr:hypothetical protein [Terrimicrobiaceae bacterium]
MAKRKIQRDQIIGKVYGRLTVLDEAKPQRIITWLRRFVVQCSCGNQSIIPLRDLRNNHTQSCGCYRVDLMRLRDVTHGMRDTPEYDVWSNMKRRCANHSTATHAAHYAGRGITVCARWLESFENFIEDMGRRPTDQHSLERLNNDGNYEKDNCAWTTMKVQCRNRRSNHRLTYNGETLSIAEWSERIGFTRSTIFDRLKRGWSVEKILTTPQRKNQYG